MVRVFVKLGAFSLNFCLKNVSTFFGVREVHPYLPSPMNLVETAQLNLHSKFCSTLDGVFLILSKKLNYIAKAWHFKFISVGTYV